MLGVRTAIVLIVTSAILVAAGVLLGDYFETPDEASLRQSPESVPVADPLRREVLERTVIIRGVTAPVERTIARLPDGIQGKVVTDVMVEPGHHLASGQVLLEVEGRPVIILTGTFPGWRDLVWPMPAGPDIAQLQSALAELGLFTDEVSGRFEATTLLAVLDLYASVGYEPPSRSTVQHQEFVFIPPDMRTVERVDVLLGDTLDASGVSLVSAARWVETELTVDQRQTISAGLTLRQAGGGEWSALIDRVAEIERDDSAGGATDAILTQEPIPATTVGEQVWEIVVASTIQPVLSASLAAVHMSDDGKPFVVVLVGTDEKVVPVRVGIATISRLEISPVEDDALDVGDRLVLNPDR